MPPPAAPSIPGIARYAADYERLRVRMTGRREPATPGPEMPGIGMGLVLEAGLPAWIHAITDVLGAATPTNGPVLRDASPVVTPATTSGATAGASLLRDVALPASELISAVRQLDLARLLANLVLSTRLPPRGGHGGVSPGGVSPGGVSPAGVTPAGVTPAGVTPAGVTPAGRPAHPDPGGCRC